MSLYLVAWGLFIVIIIVKTILLKDSFRSNEFKVLGRPQQKMILGSTVYLCIQVSNTISTSFDVRVV
jgi:hypothetical protein